MLFLGALIHAATQRLEREWMWRSSIFPNLKKDTSVVQLRSMTALCEDEPKQAFILLRWVPTPEKIVQYRLQCRRQPWKIYKAVLTSKSLQPDCSWCFRQLVQSYSSVWADPTPSDYSIDIPKSKCQGVSLEIYLELVLHIINYWISVLIFETLSHWNVGPKSKCKVTVWQFDMSHNRKRSQKRTLAKRPSDRDASLSNYFTEQAFIDILQFPGEKKKLYKCNQV